MSGQKSTQKSATFFNDTHEGDLNQAEASSIRKSASYGEVFEPKRPSSRLGAIRQYCLRCCNESPKEVRLCPSTRCSLHPLRMGKRSEQAPSPKHAIRGKCKDCSEYLGDIRHCYIPDCPLRPYRMGHCPKADCKATKHLRHDNEVR